MPNAKTVGLATAVVAIVASLMGGAYRLGQLDARVTSAESYLFRLEGRVDSLHRSLPVERQRAASAAAAAPFYQQLSAEERQQFLDGAIAAESAGEFRAALERSFGQTERSEREEAVRAWQAQLAPAEDLPVPRLVLPPQPE